MADQRPLPNPEAVRELVHEPAPQEPPAPIQPEAAALEVSVTLSCLFDLSLMVRDRDL